MGDESAFFVFGLQVVGGAGVGKAARTVACLALGFVGFEHAQGGHDAHDADEVDGKPVDGAGHVGRVDDLGALVEPAELVVEGVYLLVGEGEAELAEAAQVLHLTVPLAGVAFKHLLQVDGVAAELVDPVAHAALVVEQLAGEEAVLGRGDEEDDLLGRAAHHEGEAHGVCFAVFAAVAAPVVGEALVVEGGAEGVAPFAVLAPDGGDEGVGFELEDEAVAVGVDDVLHDAGAAVVAGDEIDFVDGLVGHFFVFLFFA